MDLRLGKYCIATKGNFLSGNGFSSILINVLPTHDATKGSTSPVSLISQKPQYSCTTIFLRASSLNLKLLSSPDSKSGSLSGLLLSKDTYFKLSYLPSFLSCDIDVSKL